MQRRFDGRVQVEHAAGQRQRQWPQPLAHGQPQPRQFLAGLLQQGQRLRVGVLVGGGGHGQRQLAHFAARGAADPGPRGGPVAAANGGEEVPGQWRRAPGAGIGVFGAPDAANGFAGNPVAAAGVVNHRTAAAGAVHRAVGVQAGRDGPGAGIDDDAVTGRECGVAGQFDVAHRPHGGGGHVEGHGDVGLQRGAVFAAEAGDACDHGLQARRAAGRAAR